MKKFSVALALCLFVFSATAQVSRGGQAYFQTAERSADLNYFSPALPDIDALKAEDEILDSEESIPYRFGANIDVDLGPNNAGEWITTPEGDRVWRMAVHAPGAVSLNFKFDVYDIPDGSWVFVYTPDRSTIKGGFTNENASPANSLGVGLIPGDRMIIEYFEPAEVAGEGNLHIDQLTYGYRDIFGSLSRGEAKGEFGTSGACNVNVNCPEGLPYDVEKRSVALIINNGNSVCSGSLVNNTAEDGTPYFLTAEHCLPSNVDNVSNWIFYFNHESPTCVGSDGPIDQSISGAILRAAHTNSDFALLELNEVPPAEFDVCYSGWDATDLESAVTRAYGIHHPKGDVKKICFEDDAPYHSSVSWINQVWHIDNWELGVTEGGSSGSPLFNQEGRIIGQLGGGTAHCSGSTSAGYDYYGRFAASWSHGDSPANALRFWLDPENTGLLMMPNSCSGSLAETELLIFAIEVGGNILCSTDPVTPEISVFNAGVTDITQAMISIEFNGIALGAFEWTGSVAQGETFSFSPSEVIPVDGDNHISAEVIEINGNSVEGSEYARDFTAFEYAETVTIQIEFDPYAGENSWEIRDDMDNVMYTSPYYANGTLSASHTVCLGTGCYTFVMRDSWGDGMCCSYGDGNYAVLSENGDTLASGGSFGSVDATDMCITVGTEDLDLSDSFVLYPNPATHEVFVTASSTANPLMVTQAIRIHDVSGRMVAEHRASGSETTRVDVSTLDAGIYLMVIQTAGGTATKKFAVQGH